MKDTNYNFADRLNLMPESFIRKILKVSTQPEMISFAGGLPNPVLFPEEQMAIAAEKVLRMHGKRALQYSTTEGYLPLRSYIADRESKKSGSNIVAENILILNGSQQGLDLAGKLFINKNDNILMEGPSYLGAIQAFAAYQPNFRELPIQDLLSNPKSLPDIMSKYKPQFFYINPNFQNPTGNTYDPDIRMHIAKQINLHKGILIEDNPYGELFFSNNPPPDLYTLTPHRTLYLGSFSKIIAPGLRMGWATGSREIIKKMTIAKQAADLHSNFMTQMILFEYLSDNSLDHHLIKNRNFYKNQYKTMLQLINNYFPKEIKIQESKGGMFLWVSLPSCMDAGKLLEKSRERNVLFVPGQYFYTSLNPPKNSMRLNFSNSSLPEMEKGIKILGDIMKEEYSKSNLTI